MIFILACVVTDIPRFYAALFGYAARTVFPNELYVEVQKWDNLTGLFFQGEIMTSLMIFMMILCIATIKLGDKQARGFATSVFFYALIMIGTSLVYVYGGIRWNLPLPCYLEIGAYPVYMVAGLLGIWYLWRKFRPFFASLFMDIPPFYSRKVSLFLAYGLIIFIPLFSTKLVFAKHPSGFFALTAEPTPTSPTKTQDNHQGIVKFLLDNLAIGHDGYFRGSVANLVGVPGGQLLTAKNIPESAPFTKENIDFILKYLRSYDKNLYMTGLWDLGIPTTEENNHLVTPPYHFLISRLLSRPQDYHSRNWAWITKENPKIMAALGTRYILTDRLLSDPRLSFRMVQTNLEGVEIRLYEVEHPNLADYSPIRTVLSTDAVETLSLMTTEEFSFDEVAVVHKDIPSGLTRADTSVLFFERGGVRVRASSSGNSLVVLPLQFSNSLRIVSANGSTIPRLLRVNLLQTGVLFEGTIDIKIAHVFGLFRGVEGRLQDIQDFRQLGIKETGDVPYPPNYQPLALKWPYF